MSCEELCTGGEVVYIYVAQGSGLCSCHSNTKSVQCIRVAITTRQVSAVTLKLLNYTPIASMSWRHRRKGIFIEIIWNVIVLKGVDTYTTSLTVIVPLLNLILLLSAVNILS